MNEDMTPGDIEEMLSGRASMYRMLAQLYFKPLTQEQIDALAALDLAELASEEGSSYADGYNDLYRYLRRRNTGTRQELAADYTSVFYGAQTYEGRAAQPFESLYRYDGGLIMGEASGEVFRAFRQSAVKVKDGLDLPDDHLSFIFEFMAHLCDRALEAVDGGDFDRASRILESQRAFFEAHIASWFPRFKALANKLVSTRFYRGCLKLTKAFLDEEPESMREGIEALSSLGNAA